MDSNYRGLDLSNPMERYLAINQIKQAVARNPDDPNLLIMLAEVYLSASFWHYAVDALRKALTLDPCQDKARLRLGKAYLARGMDEWQARWFSEAIEVLSKIQPGSAFYNDSRTYLAQSYFDLGIGDSAIAALRTVDRSKINVEGLLVLGLCFWQVEELDSADAVFREALHRMDQDQLQRYLFPFYLKKKPEIANGSDLFCLAEQFWRKRDSNPATPVNERLLEHIARVAFADLHFSVPRLGKAGSLTARGEVLVRYGIPTRWYFDPFGSGIVADEACFQNHYGKGGDDQRIGLVKEFGLASKIDKPSWIWDYGKFTLKFSDTFLNSDYDFPYHTSDAEIYAVITKLLPDSFELAFKRQTQILLEGINILDDHGNPAFKVNYALDRTVTEDKSTYSPQVNLLVQAAILDTSYNRIAYRKTAESIRADSSVSMLTPFPLISSLIFPSHKEARLVAIYVESLDNKAKGYATSGLEPKRFGSDLSLSDIEVRFAPSGPPNPSHSFKRNGRAYFRFEIYNPSADTNGIGEVDIYCRLELKGRKKRVFSGLLSKSIRRRTQDRLTSFSTSYNLRAIGSPIEHNLGLDLSKMQEGEYKFSLRVMDRRTGKSAEAHTNILVVP
ncbi:MAG: GWxTD domain-containing protein [bacterium]